MRKLIISSLVLCSLLFSKNSQAGTAIGITLLELDKRSKEITTLSKASYNIESSNQKYYIIQLNSDNIIADMTNDAFFNRLNPSDIDAMKAMQNDKKYYFKKRWVITFNIDSTKTRPGGITKINRMLYCIEEMQAVENIPGTYSLEYMKLNRINLNHRFGKLLNEENIDDVIDTSHDKMILKEDKNTVTFLSFDYGQENPFKTNTALGRYMYTLDVPAVVNVPFVFNVKYQNSNGSEIFLDRLSAMEISRIEISRIPVELAQSVQYNLHLVLIPYSYVNGEMEVRVHILRERELYSNDDKIDSIYYTADEKNLSFSPSDVIEVKLDGMFPIEGEIDIGVNGESVIIKPIRID